MCGLSGEEGWSSLQKPPRSEGVSQKVKHPSVFAEGWRDSKQRLRGVRIHEDQFTTSRRRSVLGEMFFTSYSLPLGPAFSGDSDPSILPLTPSRVENITF